MTTASLAAERAILRSLTVQPIEIAVDTEFFGRETLSIQTACRLAPGVVAVKVYRSPSVPLPSIGFRMQDYLPKCGAGYKRFFSKLRLRPVGLIDASLSPVRLLRDLHWIPKLIPCSRNEFLQFRNDWSAIDGPCNGVWNSHRQFWQIPFVNLTITGHFLPADMLRIFGRTFFAQLFAQDPTGPAPVVIRDGKVIGFATLGQSFQPPIVEYARTSDGALFAVRIQTRDTLLPFGPDSLDRLSQTFLGVGKSECLSSDAKANMLEVFRGRPDEAYGYAITDVVNTLLLGEEMAKQDRQLYREFGCRANEMPKIRGTVGARVASFLTNTAYRTSAAGSHELASNAAFLRLMRGGGTATFAAADNGSRFGAQTGSVHGGLILSRSPTRLWHDAKGMLCDVDMAACYASIISRMNVYLGKPVIFEPGDRAMRLDEAVALLQQHADSDAWLVRVTGNMSAMPNVLIPSCLGAKTVDNYHTRLVSSRNAADHRGAKLFSRRIESGVVTWATWAMISALPPAARRDYELLSVDSLILYPRMFVASDGPGYDQLVANLKRVGFSWSAQLDLGEREIRETIQLDDRYATLKFPIGECARRLAEMRKEAQQKHGKGSGADAALKLQANSMYGVVASAVLPTHNTVAANQITAHARAEAFALMLSLNGVQLITDGCTFRRDQIPNCTLAECLRRQPDYPLRRAESDSPIPFIKPDRIPLDDEELTTWYRGHVMRFFQADGGDFGKLVAAHRFEFKRSRDGGDVAFDALACDGSGNYVKCHRDAAGDFAPFDAALRGYGPASQTALIPWIVETYSSDTIAGLPPTTEDVTLIKLKEARLKVRRAFQIGIAKVIVPLGFQLTKVRQFKAIKHSAFVFQTPDQHRTIERQIEKFTTKTGCGLEVLAMRRGYGDRPAGSLKYLATEIFELIQAGGRDLTKALNINRPLGGAAEEMCQDRLENLELRRTAAELRLFDQMDASHASPTELLTGVVVTPASCPW